MPQQTDLVALGYDIASIYSSLPNVEAVVMAGSQIGHNADEDSDIDLYVYLRDDITIEKRAVIARQRSTHAEIDNRFDDITIEKRAVIARQRSTHAEIDNRFWEPGDEWIEYDTHIGVDVMFRRKQWISDEIKRITVMHNASVGYSTCLWYNVQNSQILYDRNGWYADLQQHAKIDYPPELQQAIIQKNYPILRSTLSSYYLQLQKAIKRHDLVSINHRLAALIASYFDILFAINKQPHPGEKRLILLAEELCTKLPENMRQDIESVLISAGTADPRILDHIRLLIDRLDIVLKTNKLYPDES